MRTLAAPSAIRSAEVVLPCAELDPTLAFFLGLGFRVDAISPADAPRVAVISGHGVRLRLEVAAAGAPGELRLVCDDPAALGEHVAPNGTRVVAVAAAAGPVVPPLSPSFVLTRQGDDAHVGLGRAGMRYRDLIPDRQGGRFIGSTIALPDGGPVPDYVHYHEIRFQLIYCRAGRVRVVYEDQGPPFELRAGDCVLQPPGIRHRVLESSPGLEVIELTCPAEHATLADHELALPTAELRPDREFGGQRFVRHEAAGAVRRPWRHAGFAVRDTGIGAATGGLAGVRVIGADGGTRTASEAHGGELLFRFVLAGAVALARDGAADERLRAGDCVVIPPGMRHAFVDASPDLEWLEVSLPDVLPGA